ncbi:MAG: hypothetical protein AB8B51_05705 [Sedimentitalea sp.]
MYIRFESMVRDRWSRAHLGVFCAAYELLYERPDLEGHWQFDEMHRLLDWFNAHLRHPRNMIYRPGRKGEVSGVCWFHHRARRHVSQARYMAWLVSDLGVPIQVRRTTQPGRILWSSNLQIVASPHLAR